MMMKKRRLLNLIDEFIAETGMGESYFGRYAGAGTELIKRLRDGRDVTTKTERLIKLFIRHHRRHGKPPQWAIEKMQARGRKARARKRQRIANNGGSDGTATN